MRLRWPICRRLGQPATIAIWSVVAACAVVCSSVRGQTVSWPQPSPPPSSQTIPPAAPPADDGASFKAYVLHQTDPETARQQLAQFFASTPGVETVADVPRNRVLVRGNPQVLQQADQLIAKLDQPPVNNPATAPATAPQQQLEAYALTPASRNVLVALQSQAAGRSDVRVAVDQRTSQALVLRLRRFTLSCVRNWRCQPRRPQAPRLNLQRRAPCAQRRHANHKRVSRHRISTAPPAGRPIASAAGAIAIASVGREFG